MATQQETTDQVKALTAQVTKIGTETRTLLDRITDLLAQVAAGGNTSPALADAVDALKAQVTIVDDLVPDAPSTPRPPTP